MKRIIKNIGLSMLTVFSLQALAQGDYQAPQGTPEHIRKAVESQERPAEQRARDANRLPAEILTLAGLKPGDKVIEITSFGQYYTHMLASAVGSEGMIYMYDMPYMTRFNADANGKAFAASHPNSRYEMIDYNAIDFPQSVDAAYNVLYYHDFGPLDIDTAAMNAKIFAALKPGGKYLIIDHKAEDGSGWRDAGTIHRMGVETIIEEITAAGFELVENSDLLAHPEDDRTKMVFDPSIRGLTDRAVFVFQKP